MGSIVTLDEYVENDTLPDLVMRLRDTDISGYTIQLHIAYKPWTLVLGAVLTSPALGRFTFSFTAAAESTLGEALVAGATTLKVDPAHFASFPSSGEVVIDSDEAREHLRYSSKSGVDTLVLTDAVQLDHSAGVIVKRLPDLRAGTWKAHVQVTNASNKTRTIKNLRFTIEPEYA